jgi:outer membrane receptor protein involved in Fe transport
MKKLLPLAIASLSTLASADELLPEIIVTSEFRPTDLQSAAASISVIAEDAIKERNAQHLQEVLALTPNVNFASGGSRARFVQIRGIGDRSEFKQPVNSSVGLIIDNVDFTGIGSAATLFDVNQVEVLRGPQGTRYGANALAGLIAIQSNAPTREFEGKLEAGVANQGGRQYGAVFSGPLSESLLGRIAFQRYEEDGAIRNVFLNRDTMDQDELSMRGRLRWLASDTFSVDIVASRTDVDNGYDAFTLDNTRETLADEPGRDSQESNTLSLDAKWQLGTVDLRYTTAWADTDSEYSYDEDWVYDGLHPDGYTSTDAYLRSRRNSSHELRVLSTDTSRLFNDSSDWVIGIYHLRNSTDLNRRDGDLRSGYKTQTSAIYGEISSQLAEQWLLRVGLRAEDWQADYIDSDIGARNFDKTLGGGHIAVEYSQNDDSLIYARLARGYKAGGFNIDAELPEELRPFDTETLWNLELGWKASLLDERLQSRITAFYAKRDDQQVKSSRVVYTDSGQPEQFQDFTANAASGRNYGLEAEFNLQASADLAFFLNAAWLRAKFDEYSAPANQAHPDGLVLDGKDQAHAPRYQYAAGASYQLSDALIARLSVDGKDGFFFSDRHRAKSSSYTLLNAELRYALADWTFSVWGRNLTDKDYETRGFGSFGNDPRNGYELGRYVQFGEPRRFGITASLEF